MRFTTGDHVTVIDPAHWHYGSSGFVSELAWDSMGRQVYLIELTGREQVAPFTVDQLDFTEKEQTA